MPPTCILRQMRKDGKRRLSFFFDAAHLRQCLDHFLCDNLLITWILRGEYLSQCHGGEITSGMRKTPSRSNCETARSKLGVVGLSLLMPQPPISRSSFVGPTVASSVHVASDAGIDAHLLTAGSFGWHTDVIRMATQVTCSCSCHQFYPIAVDELISDSS